MKAVNEDGIQIIRKNNMGDDIKSKTFCGQLDMSSSLSNYCSNHESSAQQPICCTDIINNDTFSQDEWQVITMSNRDQSSISWCAQSEDICTKNLNGKVMEWNYVDEAP